MVNRSKAKGTNAETKIVNYLKDAGRDARRVALKGKRDEGDIHVEHPNWNEDKIVLEVKAGRQTQNVNRKTMEDWLAQTRKEAHAAEGTGYLVVARFGCSVKDYHVWSSDGRRFWYLDVFVREIGREV